MISKVKLVMLTDTSITHITTTMILYSLQNLSDAVAPEMHSGIEDWLQTASKKGKLMAMEIFLLIHFCTSLLIAWNFYLHNPNIIY